MFAELTKAVKDLCLLIKGGEGSGNFGHEGRPGEIGGSGSGGGGRPAESTGSGVGVRGPESHAALIRTAERALPSVPDDARLIAARNENARLADEYKRQLVVLDEMKGKLALLNRANELHDTAVKAERSLRNALSRARDAREADWSKFDAIADKKEQAFKEAIEASHRFERENKAALHGAIIGHTAASAKVYKDDLTIAQLIENWLAAARLAELGRLAEEERT